MKTATKTIAKKSAKRLMQRKSRQRQVKLLEMLVQQKKEADKGKDSVASCATRTVEWPSTHKTAEDRHKLLFALALGLIPKFDKIVEASLSVKLHRMDPVKEYCAKAVTQNRLNDLQEKRSNSNRSKRWRLRPKPCLDHLVLVPLYLLPEVEEPHVSPENCEMVDLVSDDDNESIVEIETDDLTYELITLTDDDESTALEKIYKNQNIVDLSLSDDDEQSRIDNNNNSADLSNCREQANYFIPLDCVGAFFPPTPSPHLPCVTLGTPNHNTPISSAMFTPSDSESESMHHISVLTHANKSFLNKSSGNPPRRKCQANDNPARNQRRKSLRSQNKRIPTFEWVVENEA